MWTIKKHDHAQLGLDRENHSGYRIFSLWAAPEVTVLQMLQVQADEQAGELRQQVQCLQTSMSDMTGLRDAVVISHQQLQTSSNQRLAALGADLKDSQANLASITEEYQMSLQAREDAMRAMQQGHAESVCTLQGNCAELHEQVASLRQAAAYRQVSHLLLCTRLPQSLQTICIGPFASLGKVMQQHTQVARGSLVMQMAPAAQHTEH